MATNTNLLRECAGVLNNCADIADEQGLAVAISHALAPALGQIQQQMQQMQQQMQQMQQALTQEMSAIRQSTTRLEWNTANRRIRQLNDANSDLRPLHKERAGGEYQQGDLPPPRTELSADAGCLDDLVSRGAQSVASLLRRRLWR